MKIRKILIGIASICLVLVGFYVFGLYPNYEVPILMYHRFGYDQSTLFVTPENFDRQMAYLKNKGYDVISLDELVEGIKDRKKFNHNTVAITIDDGYKDNFIYAYPVLKKYRFPATIFIVTDLIGKGSIGKEKKFLNWDEVIAMSKDRISFGGHTKTHFYLGLVIDENIALEEISGSKKAIEQKIGMPVDYFCYPFGGFNERAKELVAKAGYKGACTTNRGFARFNSDVYELKRIKVTNNDATKPFSFWAKLSGYYTCLLYTSPSPRDS